MNNIQLSPEGEVNSGRYIYPPLFTDPEGDSCFSIYQIRWIKKHYFNFFFWTFRETTRHFSLRLQNSEYPRIFRVTGANQNARKLLSTDLENTYILLTKREVKMAGYWPSSLFAFLWTETKSRSIKTQKENEANTEPSWPN